MIIKGWQTGTGTSEGRDLRELDHSLDHPRLSA